LIAVFHPAGRNGRPKEVEMKRGNWTWAFVLACLATGAGWDAHLGANDLCGATVTADVRLDHDLVCTGDGLIIGADGISVDLNGHTVTGPGSGAGILVGGRADITIAGGVIRNFAVAIRLNAATGVVIRNTEFAGNGEALDLQAGSIGNTVKENVFRDSTIRAIMLRSNSRDNDIKSNILTGNRIGILVFGGIDNQIKDNVVSGSGLAGIRLNVIATGNVIKHNTVDASPVGIDFIVTPTGSATGNELKDNTLSGNACGLNGPTSGNTLKDNHFVGNVADVCS
jgi:parallel beta-helix repeat protein